MYLLFDIGGTNIRVAWSEDGTHISEPVIFPTPHEPQQAVEAIAHAVETLGAQGKVRAASGGIAGVLDDSRNVLLRSPNLKQWMHIPIADLLKKALNVPIYLENDAAIVGLGEAHHGAGKGYSIVEYITVSTGVGGARIVDGTIDERSVGFEPGQEFFSINNGEPITLENMVSGTAVEKRFGKKPKEITDQSVWEELAHTLAYGLYNTIVLWSPDVVVLGGPMIVGNPAIPLDRISYHISNILTIFPKPPLIKKAELDAMGGLWGALEFIKTKHV